MNSKVERRDDARVAAKVSVNEEENNKLDTSDVSNSSARRPSRFTMPMLPYAATSQKAALQESWKATNWDEMAEMKSSNTSSLKASQNSIYLNIDAILGFDTKDGKGKQLMIPTKKRKPLYEVLKDDEEAFETSIASLRVSMENKKSDRGGGELTSSMISSLSGMED